MKWQAKGFRGDILKTKNELPDEYVFLSERYLKLLRRISGQITRTHFMNIRIDNDRSKPAGSYDGSVISVNLANPITQSFPNKDLKNKSLIGLLGHECGHENYSNPYLRRRYLRGILQERKIYPHAPVPQSKKEQAALESMKWEFGRKVSAAVYLFYELAGYLSNLLEDMYIEHRMSSRFPGNIREGIVLNNMRIAESTKSVRAMLEDGEKKSIVVSNMIVQYAVSGQVNCWDGCGQEYLDCLDSCIPLINKAVSAPGESARYEATNQILLKIWDFILEDAAGMEKEQKEREDRQKRKEEEQEEQETVRIPDKEGVGSEENRETGDAEGDGADAAVLRGSREPVTGDPDTEQEVNADDPGEDQETCTDVPVEQQERDSGASKGTPGSGADSAGDNQGSGMEAAEGTNRPDVELSDESGERLKERIHNLSEVLPQYSTDCHGGRTGEAGDMKWDGCWNDVQECNETAAGEQDPGDAGDEAEHRTKQDAEDNADPWSFAEETVMDKEENPGFDQEASSFVYQMAKDVAELIQEEQMQVSLRELMDGMDFGVQHMYVHKRVYRVPVPDMDDRTRFTDIERQVKQISKRLHALLLPILEKRMSRLESGMMIGRKVSSRTLYRPDRRIFARRLLESNECDVSIAALVDLSCSMEGDRVEYAKLAILTLYHFSVEAEIPVAVYGHNTRHDGAGDETVGLYCFADFGMVDDKDRFRIMDMRTMGRNRDGVAVRFVGELLKKRPERQKLFVLISDGMPNACGYRGETAKEDLKKAKAELEQTGITFLTASIGSDRYKIREIYGDDCLDITDIRKLPELLAKRVLRIIS